MTNLRNNYLEEESGFIDLASDNQDLRNKIACLLDNLNTISLIDLEDQVIEMMQNMMNFFAKHVDEIPSFDTLTPEQKKILLLRFKGVAHSLPKRKIKFVDEMVQVFVFTVLSNIGASIEGVKDLSAQELLNKKHKHQFREFLKKAADYELYKITNPNRLAGETREENFISNAILLGVKKALKYAGLEHSIDKIDPNALKILEKAHQDLKKPTKGLNLNI